MHVRSELLRQSEPILAALRKHGWEVVFRQDGVSARHPPSTRCERCPPPTSRPGLVDLRVAAHHVLPHRPVEGR
jgi:hypothetical protein